MLLEGCSLEVNEGHYFGREIRSFYDDSAFPYAVARNGSAGNEAGEVC